MDFADGTLQQVEALTIPQFQPMQLIKGDLAEIERQLQQFADYAGELPVWLDIEVATQDYLSDIQRRIQLMADELPVEVVLLRRSKEQRRRDRAAGQGNAERAERQRGVRNGARRRRPTCPKRANGGCINCSAGGRCGAAQS